LNYNGYGMEYHDKEENFKKKVKDSNNDSMRNSGSSKRSSRLILERRGNHSWVEESKSIEQPKYRDIIRNTKLGELYRDYNDN
jgi:hypothetical protein